MALILSKVTSITFATLSMTEQLLSPIVVPDTLTVQISETKAENTEISISKGTSIKILGILPNSEEVVIENMYGYSPPI